MGRQYLARKKKSYSGFPISPSFELIREFLCKQLPPNLLTAIDVQAVLNNNVWKIIPNA